jgi:hypothetical protein
VTALAIAYGVKVLAFALLLASILLILRLDAKRND